MEPRKLLLLGDSGCGKTRLIQTFFRKNIPDAVTYTEFVTIYHHKIRNTTILICDVRGNEAVAPYRWQCYDGASMVFFCYAVDDPGSFKNLQEIWIPEFKEHCSDLATFFLVGNKGDLKFCPNVLNRLSRLRLHPVLRFQAVQLLKKHRSIKGFYECSVCNAESVDAVFNAAFGCISTHNES
ncbi:GTP-binding protein rho1 [Araneus ventricosus]|uniref:GTP-binding protein rho1 n=1 Tax=Araneus ventricosus TaxID=182803 RepID=A0A4Y2N785_ARAVE|nr:GTP-binding protein rho1 [Araneus ventricosus]